MIGKITTGKGAGGTISYVCEKDGAQVLSSTWSGSHEGWAAQFKEHSDALNPALTEHGQSVVHVSLNAAPGERLSDDQWRAVAEEYLSRMGWGGHDHAVVRHTDAGHDHVHIVISRVGHEGQTADLHHDYARQERVLDSLERDFGLERTHEQLREQAERNPFAAVESVTRNHLTFDRADIDRYFERLGFEHEKVRELTDTAMGDGRVLFADTSGPTDKFTTTTVVAEVQRLDSALHQLAAQEARPTLDRGEFGREGLSDGQRAAADRIAAGGGLVVIEGFAGSGKSTMLRAAVDDLRFSGHDVVGVGSTGKAAKGLAALGGLESNTLTSTLGRIERGELKLTASSVVILDEAGMARNDELGALAQRVANAGGRLVLVGDDKQLGAVGRGGGFAHAREILGTLAARLDEIFRQRDGWQRDASKAFGEGRAREAIQAYVDHGKVDWAASRGTARDMLVSDYVRELGRGTSPDKMLALAHENRDVRLMNAEIREAIKERGGLTGERTYRLENTDGKAQKIGLAVGDRVVFDRNSRDVDGKAVKNGEFGTVEQTDSRGFSVRMDDGSSRRVEDGSKQQMSHGYASSIHKSQGSTIDRVFLLASRGLDAALSYVGLSRQKDDVKIYANKTEFKNEEHLKNSLSRDNGREAFKSVLAAGDGKESAPSRTTDRDHAAGAGPAGERAQPERERQPVAAFVTAAAFDQGKVSTGLLDGKQVQQAKGEEQRPTQEKAQPAREAEQEKSQGQAPTGEKVQGEGKESSAAHERQPSQPQAGQQAKEEQRTTSDVRQAQPTQDQREQGQARGDGQEQRGDGKVQADQGQAGRDQQDQRQEQRGEQKADQSAASEAQPVEATGVEKVGGQREQGQVQQQTKEEQRAAGDVRQAQPVDERKDGGREQQDQRGGGKQAGDNERGQREEGQGEAQAQTKGQDQPTRENQAWQEAQPAREGERREQGQDKQLREKSWGAGDSSAGRVQQQNTGQEKGKQLEKVLGKDQRHPQGKSESKQKHGPQVQAGKDKKSKGYGL